VHKSGTSYWIYKAGDAWGICDVCGFRYYQSQLSKRWDGLMVCPSDHERRQPQDTIKSVKEKIYVENPRPEAADKFLAEGEITESDL